jgi:hypothetical protein
VTGEPTHPARMTNPCTALPSSIYDMSEASATAQRFSAAATALPEEDISSDQGIYMQEQDQTTSSISTPTSSLPSSASLSVSRSSSSTSTSSVGPALPASSASATSTHPTFTCRVDNCGTDLLVDFRTLKQHLSAVHGYPPVHRGHALQCCWSSC